MSESAEGGRPGVDERPADPGAAPLTGQGVRTAPTPEPDELPLPGHARVMAMLSEHVPLSLLVDLTAPGGPDSRRLLDEEGLPDDAWWDRPAG